MRYHLLIKFGLCTHATKTSDQISQLRLHQRGSSTQKLCVVRNEILPLVKKFCLNFQACLKVTKLDFDY
jgi:hypothetical protein